MREEAETTEEKRAETYFAEYEQSVISIFLGYLSWKWIEKPFRDKNIVSSKGIFNYFVYIKSPFF